MKTTSNNENFVEGFAVVSVLKPKWGWLFFSGLLAILFGIVAFSMPLETVYAMTLLFGAFAAVDGILSIISAVRGKGNFWPLLLRGALGLFVGIIMLALPALSAVSLVVFAWAMLSIWLIATGLLELIAAIGLRKEIHGEWLLGLSGVVSLVFGIAIPIVLWSNPSVGVVTMGWMIGFFAVLHGLLEIALSLLLRKFQTLV